MEETSCFCSALLMDDASRVVTDVNDRQSIEVHFTAHVTLIICKVVAMDKPVMFIDLYNNLCKQTGR